jgi:glycosyltransferase involved in cell wall biosynthesis
MRVAFDVGPIKPEPAGVGTYVRELAKGLADRLGPERLRFVGALPGLANLPSGIETRRRRSMPYSAWVLTAKSKDLGSTDCNVVHHTDGLVPLRRSRPTVVTIQDLTAVTRWREHRLVRLARIPFVLASPRLANAVVTPSRASADEIMRITGSTARSIFVIPLAARSQFRARSAKEVTDVCTTSNLEPGRYLLVPGTLEPRKNGLRLIRAFERGRAEQRIPPDVQLAFAGGRGWNSDAVLQAARASEYRDQIKLLGYVSDDALAALMSGASAVVYVSLAEGFGLPVLEALACGAPVLTSDRSSMPEVGGDVAWLVDPTDAVSIAGKFGDLVGLSAASRASLAAAGRLHASRFSWSRTASETVGVYEAVA